MIPIERFRHLARHLLHLIRSGRYREFTRKFGQRIYGETVLVGMRLDLLKFQREQVLPDQITVRPVRTGEVPRILDFGEPGLPRREIHERVIRHQMLAAGIRTCYIAEDAASIPCFVQWVIGADQNDLLKRRIRGWYPRLSPQEVLIEYAYTLAERRGAGIMPAVTSHLLDGAKRKGARSAVAFVPSWNGGSLRIHLRMGFSPYLLFREKRRFLSRSRSCTPISEIPAEI
jgi:GNAT superfamily N-acetyltransferase